MYLPDTLFIRSTSKSHHALVVVTVMGNVSISIVSGSHFELLISISSLYITLSNKDPSSGLNDSQYLSTENALLATL